MSKKLSFNFSEKTQIWGEKVESLNDVIAVFVKYLQGKIKKFPFAEGYLQPETDIIMAPLVRMNENKLFTINSQPKVNGAPSNDVKFGWGPDKGYVY